MNWKARISLMLVFAMLFSAFMYQGWYKPKFTEATGTTNGRVVHSQNTATPLDKGYTASTNTFAAGAAMTAGAAAPTFMVNRSCPARTENMAGFVTTGGDLHIYKFDGTNWIEVTNTAAPSGWGVGTRPNVGGNGVNGRRFDIAYEQTSGKAMVVYSTNATGAAGNEMAYRIWDGVNWTAVAYINSTNLTRSVANNAVTWIKMASRPGSNDLALTAVDNGNAAVNTATLTSFIWNSSTTTWGNEPGTAHDATYTCSATITTGVQYDNFDLAYESLAGQLVVVFSRQAGTILNAYRVYNPSTGWGGVTALPGGTQRLAQQTYAVANPRTNQIMAFWVRSGTAGIFGHIWNGSAWTNQVSLGITMLATASVNKKWITGQWLTVGGTEYAVAIAQTSTIGTLGYSRSTDGITWTAATLTGVGAGAILSWVDSDVDPWVPDTLMFTGSYLNGTNILLARRLVLTAGPTFTWTTPTGSPMGSALTNVTTQNFAFAYDRKDTTPPTAGTVTVSPDTGTYTSGSPTITTVFTDAQSAVTSCEYTTNGSTWNPGNMSGSSPNYTCTGLPLGLSGALTINMRATSGGGTTTATAINRTVDAAGPTDGALTVALADPTSLFLSWTAATDGASGLRTTNTYDLRFLAGATPPTCSTGTSIYTGTGLSYTHTGLSTGQQYSYSVCAYDNVNNPSAGATGSGAPKWSSTISSCSGCHGYLSLFPDGTTRNTPEGRFVGSHNKHVISAGKVCNVCHVTPATETSVDYGHRDSNIKMKAGATVIDGGYYDKNNSTLYETPADDTFAQTNAPVMQTCRTVYCHSLGTSNTTNLGETRTIISVPLVNLNWGSAGTCASCHGNPPNYANQAATWGAAKANSHGKHTTQCSTCHYNTTTNSTSITGPANHANKGYTVVNGNGATFTSYTYDVGGGSCTVISCHSTGGVSDTTRQWGGAALPIATFDCVQCHKVTQAITVGPLAGTSARRAVSLEFANTWSHKRSATPTGAVTKYDCCVCHMEGVTATGVIDAAYHGDGYINLRDPDLGTNIKGVNWDGLTPGSYTSTASNLTFARFSRNLSSNTLEPEVAAIQINHCLKCHDTGGAASTLAQVTGGVALKPFNTTITGHVAPYDSNGNGNLVDVNKSFNTTNASYHPVRGKANNSYAQGTKMIAPWNMTKTNGNTTSWGYLISCWDCHALSTDAGTITKTVTAHGATATLRGSIRVAGTTAATNLCINCHATSYSSIAHVSAGSAVASGPDTGAMGNTYWSNCSYCHANGPANAAAGYETSTARPLRAEDVHGFNDRTAGTVGSVFATYGTKPYAFFRGSLESWRPASSPEVATQTNGNCVGTGGVCNNNMSTTYTPGGAY